MTSLDNCCLATRITRMINETNAILNTWADDKPSTHYKSVQCPRAAESVREYWRKLPMHSRRTSPTDRQQLHPPGRAKTRSHENYVTDGESDFGSVTLCFLCTVHIFKSKYLNLIHKLNVHNCGTTLYIPCWCRPMLVSWIDFVCFKAMRGSRIPRRLVSFK
jgi:hypothetical protein